MASKSQLALRALTALCGVLLIGEFIIHRHAYFALEATPLFFVIYGLIILALALGVAHVLARLVTRPLDYYDADMHEGSDDV